VSRTQIELYLGFLDRGIEGTDMHSMIGNLKDVTEADYVRVPEGGRPIWEMVRHAASAKHVYASAAFVDGSVHWEQVRNRRDATEGYTMADDIEWLRDGQRIFRDGVAALSDDSELAHERGTHWGARVPTERIIRIMIEHDIYHAGEINHLRALIQGTDYWAGRRPS
jgi:hypothetical protein